MEVVIWGLGEMGGVFARGLLRAGCTVTGLTRAATPAALAAEIPAPGLVLVAVAEGDLHEVLADVPAEWRSRIGLLQNELLPGDWKRHDISDPTVAVVWFEKKPGRDVTVITTSPVAGPEAGLMVRALGELDIPAEEVAPGPRLLFELVRKNLYILTANIAGLEGGGTVGDLWSQHRVLCRDVAREVVAIQSCLAGTELDETALWHALEADFGADPTHGARGRSAPARLQRARKHAAQCAVATPTLDWIAKRHAAAS